MIIAFFSMFAFISLILAFLELRFVYGRGFNPRFISGFWQFFFLCIFVIWNIAFTILGYQIIRNFNTDAEFIYLTAPAEIVLLVSLAVFLPLLKLIIFALRKRKTREMQ